MGIPYKNNRDQKQSFLILSAELYYKDTEANKNATKDLKELLDSVNLSYKQVLGCYYNNSEVSFIVPMDTKLGAEILSKRVMRMFQQASVLYVDSSRNAELWFNGSTQPLGKFQGVPKRLATQCQNYTQDGDQYYICY